MNEFIFPPEIQLKVEAIKQVEQHLDIYARSQRPGASCPDCHRFSTDIHASYWRHPQDLPCLGLTVRLHLAVRRFACRNQACSRKTFAEEFRELLRPKARRTVRLRQHHLATAYVLGGEAGGRLAHWLGMPISGDTLIREIRQAPEPPAVSVRVVGVDDWAMRRGTRYGTILVDLEQGRPIDILGTREAAEVASWFQAHPEIEIVSRRPRQRVYQSSQRGCAASRTSGRPLAPVEQLAGSSGDFSAAEAGLFASRGPRCRGKQARTRADTPGPGRK